jgi:acyl-coenzyme A synthetase/AMP-(fatty) acid ligase/acyl carrier protein
MSPIISTRVAKTANRRRIGEAKIDDLPPMQQAIRARCAAAPGIVAPTVAHADAAIHRCVEAQAAKTPDRIAVVSSDGTFSYRALNEAANRLARLVLKCVAPADVPVVLDGAPGVDALISSLAALKAGHFVAYLDLCASNSRLRAQIALLEPRVIISRTGLPASSRLGALVLDPADAVAGCAEDLDIDVRPGAIARIALTSGSTGEPKGIVQTHHAILHGASTRNDAVQLAGDDRLLLVTSSFTELWRPLLAGAALHLFDLRAGIAALQAWCGCNAVTIFRSTPTVFRRLLETIAGEQGDSGRFMQLFPSLRVLEMMGEPLSADCVRLYQRHCSRQCVMVNFLGAKEVLDYRVFYIDPATPATDAMMPAGYPLGGAKASILDEDGAPVPANATGEIAVTTESMASGYWRDTALTEERFRTDTHGTRYFLTRDLGALRDDRCLVHLGRRDFVVKIHGQRVDVGHVEEIVRQLPGVKEAAVVDVRDGADKVSLAAFLVTSGQVALDERALRRSLRSRLHDVMIPATFTPLPAMPTTAMGKIDREALRSAIRASAQVPGAGERPKPGKTERTLAEIFIGVLGDRDIADDDNFFDLGCDSLTMMQIIARIERRFRIRIPLSALFDRMTVAELARLVRERSYVAREQPPMRG